VHPVTLVNQRRRFEVLRQATERNDAEYSAAEMITTVSGYPEAEMGEKDLSPQQSLLTHSYDEEEFDIPQVITIVWVITQEVGTENGRVRYIRI
jgi:hypothetical protein